LVAITQACGERWPTEDVVITGEELFSFSSVYCSLGLQTISLKRLEC